MLLSDDPQIEVVGVASNGREAIEQLGTLDPDLVLMDVEMPGLDGFAVTEIINKKFPEVKVLFLTTFGDKESLRRSTNIKSFGYILKGASSDELKQAIFSAYKGYSQYSPELIQNLSANTNDHNIPESQEKIKLAEVIEKLSKLTLRELEVFKLVAKGFNNRDISIEMCISQKTVKNYITNVLNRLDIKDRQEIITGCGDYIKLLENATDNR